MTPQVRAPDRPDREGPSLARDGARTVAGSLVSAACNVLVVVALARWLGAEGVGYYTIAFAIRAILLLVCGLGTRTAMTRFVAAGLARGDHASVRGAVRAGIAVTAGVSAVVGAAWAVLAAPLSRQAFDTPSLALPFVLSALSLPFFVVTTTALAATQGFQTMRPYTGVGLVFEPVTRLLLTVAVLGLGGGVAGAMAALLAASVLTAVLAVGSLHGLLRRLPGDDASPPWRELVAFCGQSWVASMATQGLLWADIVILGVLVSAADVGVYQIATRLVLLAMLVVTPLTASMAPRISFASARHDVATVTDRYVRTVHWVAWSTLPLLAGLVAVPGALLDLFGAEFAGATSVVLLLAAGAVAEVLGAPAAVVLNQVRHNGVNMVVNLAALALNVALNLLLIPRWGIDGAAAAWAATLVLGALVRTAVVRRLVVSRTPFSAPLAAAVLAAAAAGTLAAGAATLVPEVPVVRIAVAGMVLLLVCGPAVVRFGLGRRQRDQVSRAVALRLPALRRWRTGRRLRRAASGTEVLDIDQLVRPFRYDVLCRAELYALARDHADLRQRDLEAFLDLVRASGYRAWFDAVLVGRGHVTGSPEQLEATFRSVVAAALQLLGRHDQRASLGEAPGPALGRVTVARVPAGTDLEGWVLTADRWVLLDGGHRVALALLDGRRELGTTDYVVESGVRPPNNTARMLAAGALHPEEVERFLDEGAAGSAVRRADAVAATGRA